MNTTDWQPFLKELADRADALALRYFRAGDLHIDEKPDRSLVTQADLEIEQTIREFVKERHPELGVFGEEQGEGDTRGATRLIVDPIDATANFARGIPVFGTLLAVEHQGEVVAGLVSAPALGQRWHAAEARQSKAPPARTAADSRVVVQRVEEGVASNRLDISDAPRRVPSLTMALELFDTAIGGRHDVGTGSWTNETNVAGVASHALRRHMEVDMGIRPTPVAPEPARPYRLFVNLVQLDEHLSHYSTDASTLFIMPSRDGWAHDARWKFVVGHELGHMAASLFPLQREPRNRAAYPATQRVRTFRPPEAPMLPRRMHRR